MKIRVLLVDEHELARYGVRQALAGDDTIEIVGEVATASEAIKLARFLTPDIVLMDLELPILGSLGATREIAHFNTLVKVLIFTSSKDAFFPRRLLAVGAWGLIAKGAGKEELLRAIVKSHQGVRYLSTEIACKVFSDMGDGEKYALFDQLSTRELQISLMISSGMKGKNIAEKLGISPKTISTYRGRIYKKLKVRSDVELFYLALEHNLLESK